MPSGWESSNSTRVSETAVALVKRRDQTGDDADLLLGDRGHRERDVLGGQRLAVGPREVVAKGHPGGAAAVLVTPLGGHQGGLLAAQVHLHELGVHQVGDPGVGAAVADQRVEVDDVGGRADDDLAGLLGIAGVAAVTPVPVEPSGTLGVHAAAISAATDAIAARHARMLRGDANRLLIEPRPPRERAGCCRRPPCGSRRRSSRARPASRRCWGSTRRVLQPVDVRRPARTRRRRAAAPIDRWPAKSSCRPTWSPNSVSGPNATWSMPTRSTQ